MTSSHFTSITNTLKEFFGHSPQLRELWHLIQIRDAWEKLPAIIRNNASPVRFDTGVLTVEVSSTVWVQELSLKKRQLLAHIGSIYPESLPTEMRFKLAAGAKQTKQPRPAVREPNPPERLIPTVHSPAWEALRMVREKAKHDQHSWSEWFLKITEEWFIDEKK